jgi:tetratricopeptide (TPR) repeat protein
MIRLGARLFGCLLFCWTAVQTAAAVTADEAFDLGVAAFEAGDFSGASQYFEQARGAGMDTAALHYNLGASLYKLERYAEAQQAFAACARDPAWAALARYNMGLAAFQQGKRAEAADYFTQVWRHADDDKLAALALTMLERLDPFARWYPRGMFSFGLGYDGNVVLSDQVQTASATGRSDAFTELLASAGARLGRTPRAPRWEAAIYDLRYFDLQEYSITEALLGLDVPWQVGPGYVTAGGQWRYLLRDGGAFQQLVSLKAGVSYPWAGDRMLRIDGHYDRIEALDDNFQFLEGRRLEIGASLMQPVGAGWVHYGVSSERNNREDLASGGEFFSYSPSRTGVWLKGSWPFGARWRVEPTARYRYSRYADEDRRAGGIVQTREDSEWRAGVSARYRLTAAWQVAGEYTYSRNRSNFDEYSYTRHQVSIGVLRPW